MARDRTQNYLIRYWEMISYWCLTRTAVPCSKAYWEEMLT